MWVATWPPPATGAAAVDDHVVAVDLHRDAVDAQHGGGGFQPVALLDPQFLQAAHDRGAFGEARRHRQHQIFVDHRGCPLGRHLDAVQLRGAHPQSAPSSPPSARISLSMSAPISRNVVNSPVRSGLVMTDPRALRSLDDQGRHDRERRRGRIGRHHDMAPCSSGWPVQHDVAAVLPAAWRRSWPRNASASARYGRGSPRSRSRWSRPARPAPPAAPPI